MRAALLRIVRLPLLLFAGCGHAAPGGAWSYQGANGPEAWGRLDPRFAACSEGKTQSPVSLDGAERAALPPLVLDLHHGEGSVVDTGATFQVELAGAGGATLDGARAEFVQFHFHHPAEHHPGGRVAPLELHVVLKDARGLVVIAALIEEGAPFEPLADLFAHLPPPRERRALAGGFDPSRLLPPGREQYRYEGSLTVPPCTEGVRWILLTQSITMSAEQIGAFHARHPLAARPEQPQNGRKILIGE
jgi:carbonic anhydrase